MTDRDHIIVCVRASSIGRLTFELAQHAGLVVLMPVLDEILASDAEDVDLADRVALAAGREPHEPADLGG